MQRHMQSFVGVAISRSLGCIYFFFSIFFEPRAVPGAVMSKNVLYLS